MSRIKPAPIKKPATMPIQWNVLTTPWLEVMDSRARLKRLSVLEALEDSPALHRIVAAAPLDLFAIHRFLLTLLYWQAEDEAGVVKLRKALLSGRMPGAVIRGLASEAGQFDLFDSRRPFLQDPAVKDAEPLSAASLFNELATGTKLAHFHHGDDKTAQLCVRCAGMGLLRLAPWTPSDGQGKTLTVHGAMAIMALAVGENICETLGLNLVPVGKVLGRPKWTGQFMPHKRAGGPHLLEAFTWNPRRVYLHPPSLLGTCWRCGDQSLPTVRGIAFTGNPSCKGSKEFTQSWRDPAAFYREDGQTSRTTNEALASVRSDVTNLFRRDISGRTFSQPVAEVVAANPNHDQWIVVFPCSAAKANHNKSYDHRCEALPSFNLPSPARATFWHDSLPWEASDERTLPQLDSPRPSTGVLKYLQLAAGLDATSWAVVEQAANKTLDHSPAAFDIFTGLYWPLRNKDRTLPSRNAAWLALKLMATAGRLRPVAGRTSGAHQPWCDLVLRDSPAKGRVYPRSVPVGRHLEVALREAIRRHAQKPSSAGIDWPGLCQFIHNVTP